MDKELERRDTIIYAIVSGYLETGEPVGSGYVAKSCGLGISSATIRNVMKELEDNGFITQPHVSAGRIPTLKCYRYYVSHLMPFPVLEETERYKIRALVEKSLREKDVDLFMGHLAEVLSETTDLIGVTIAPYFEKCVFEKIEIVNLASSRYMIIISLGSGIVKTINITLDRVIPRAEIEETARILTGMLHGLMVSEVKAAIGKRIESIRGANRPIFDVILDSTSRLLGFYQDRDIHVAGLSRILSMPDFAKTEYSMKLAGLFEHKKEIADAVARAAAEEDDFRINIGMGGVLDYEPSLSMISAKYRTGENHGVVAVLGPTRIQYPKLMAILRYTAEVASGFFSS
jgi:heat-inducible transcriptional repressor